MKRCFVFLTAVIAVLLGTVLIVPAASAQRATRATIPFAFSANHQVLPAGCYTVVMQSDNYLRFVSCDTGKMAGLLVRTTNAYQDIRQGSLVFQLVGQRYQLTEVRFAFSNLHSELAVQPKREREIANNAKSANIEIAMN